MEELEISKSQTSPAPGEEKWAAALSLPCRFSAEVLVSRFTLGQLLRIEVDSVVRTGYEEGAAVPVYVNGQLIGWGQFEVAGDRLAVRMIELA